MARLAALDPGLATGQAKTLMNAIHTTGGSVPNVFRTMANAPAVLEGFLALRDALGRGQLSASVREQIALAVGEANRCQYCVSAHTAMSKRLGLLGPEIEAARQGLSADPKIKAALQFTQLMVSRRGNVGDEGVARLRQAGYSDGEIMEIVAQIALNIFTNYVNHVADTAVDFPKVELSAARHDTNQ